MTMIAIGNIGMTEVAASVLAPIPLPDLKIESVTFSRYQSGGTARVGIKNVGQAAAYLKTDMVHINYKKADSKTVEYTGISSGRYYLRPGQAIDVLVEIPADDIVSYTANVNVPAEFRESDADIGGTGSNNQFTGNDVPILPLPDLSVDSITLDQQNKKILVKIKNIGNGDANLATSIPSHPVDLVNVRLFYKSKRGIENLVLATAAFPNGIVIHPKDEATVFFLRSQNPDVNSYTAKIDTGVRERNTANNELSADLSFASPTPSPSATPLPTAVEVMNPAASSSAILTDTEKQQLIKNLVYPIKELGNCQNKQDCQKYCDDSDHLLVCNDYALQRGFMTQAESDRIKAVTQASNGPGGCNSQDACKDFCEKPANLDACLDYAKKNKLMTDDEIAKAKKVTMSVQETKTPGGCQTTETCKTYCGDKLHADECLGFAQLNGLMSKDEVDQARRVISVNQKNEEPKADESKTERAPQNQETKAMSEPKKEESKKEVPTDEWPGGCKGQKECDTYCSDPKNDAECSKFFELSQKMGWDVRRDKSGFKEGGPAACKTMTTGECETFCKNPANRNACVGFGKDVEEVTGPKISGNMEELRQNIKSMPAQSQDCIKEAIGEENFNKIMAGEQPKTAIESDKMLSCFQQGIQKEGEEKAKKPEGQEDRDAEAERWKNSSPIEEGSQNNLLQGIPETKGISTKRSLFGIILDWFQR